MKKDMRQINRVRKLQDRLLAKIGDKYPGNFKLSCEYEDSPTIDQLRMYVFVKWEKEIESVLRNL